GSRLVARRRRPRTRGEITRAPGHYETGGGDRRRDPTGRPRAGKGRPAGPREVRTRVVPDPFAVRQAVSPESRSIVLAPVPGPDTRRSTFSNAGACGRSCT